VVFQLAISVLCHNCNYAKSRAGCLMPSVSIKQRKFMGSELSKSRADEKTQTNMSESKATIRLRKHS
jgi:hypothetical protein